MENIKISSKVSKKAKIVVLGIVIGCLALALIFLLVAVSKKNAICDDYHYYYEGWSRAHTYADCGNWDRYDMIWDEGYMYIFFFFLCIFLIFILYYWIICKMQITVSDKRVYGKTIFGRQVDLPIDSISAVGSGMFNKIVVATSSGKIKFLFIENSQTVREEIVKLIMQRQEEKKIEKTTVETKTSNVEEIKNYKELLDSGIITQEEFDQKKKQILGL